MLEGVFFDAGNTLLFPDYDIYRDIARSLGAEVDREAVIAAEAGARSSFDRAVATSGGDVRAFWPVYYTPFYRGLGLPESAIDEAVELTRRANDVEPGIWRIPVDGLEETLGRLRERRLGIGIVSNSDGRLERRLEDIGIATQFDFVVDSAVIGVSKPDVRIFRAALERGGLSAESVAYVGDYYEVDVVGARGAGMRPVLFDPVEVYGEVDCDTITRFAEIVTLVDGWLGS